MSSITNKYSKLKNGTILHTGLFSTNPLLKLFMSDYIHVCIFTFGVETPKVEK